MKVDKSLHQEVLTRYEKLHIAPYKGFINPQYELVKDKTTGEIKDVRIVYGESYSHQMLRYSQEYNTLPSINE